MEGVLCCGAFSYWSTYTGGESQLPFMRVCLKLHPRLFIQMQHTQAAQFRSLVDIPWSSLAEARATPIMFVSKKICNLPHWTFNFTWHHGHFLPLTARRWSLGVLFYGDWYFPGDASPMHFTACGGFNSLYKIH